MGKPLSADLREVVGAVLAGLSCRKASARFGVSVSRAIRWVSALRTTGSVFRRPMGGDQRSKTLETHVRIILEAVEPTPDITIEERRALLAEPNVSASHGAVWNRLARHGLSVKTKTVHASEQERSDVVAAGETWRQMQPGLDPKKLVSLDESGIKTTMARRHGRSRKGKGVVASIPHGHGKSLTFIAGLRADRIDAPRGLDRAMNGAAFLTSLREVLSPTLSKGDVVIIDNLSTQKVAGVKEAIEATGAKRLHLPPCSSDLNPIDIMVAKRKALLRKAAERTADDLCSAIGTIIDLITPKECKTISKRLDMRQPDLTTI